MAKRIRARKVLRPRSVNGLPQNATTRTAHVSKHGVKVRLRQEDEVVLHPAARSDLEDLWRESRERPDDERKLVRKRGAFGLLVVNERLLEKPDTEFRSMLLQLMELRRKTVSTVLCVQS